MSDRLAHFTRSLRDRTTRVRLGPAPALVVLPEGARPAPLLVWLHGRTASKELDAARYLRLLRAGVGTCALDLPGHGERADPALQAPQALAPLLARALGELDGALAALLEHPTLGPRVDPERLALGGMSAGGMVTLRRLGEPHRFRCALVEAAAGDLNAAGEALSELGDRWGEARRAGLDPRDHVGGWRPIPLLALHSRADVLVPVVAIERFVVALRAHYRRLGAAAPIELRTWERTGAAHEHAGFGRRAGEARRLATEFLTAHLGAPGELGGENAP